MQQLIGASGTIEPSMPVTLTAKVVSQVLRVPEDVGSIVRPGTLLVELDSRLYKANMLSAQVKYDNTKKQLTRFQALARMNFASPAEIEDAQAAKAAAYQSVVQSEIDLFNTRVVSPVPGVLLERLTNPGETTEIDQQLIKVGVLDPVYMNAAVTEDRVAYVYLGMNADVETDAFVGETFRGTVAKIDSTVAQTTRTFAVYVRLANRDLRLKKGVTGYVRLKSARMAVAVPNTAIMNPQGDRPTVFVVDRYHRAHVREVHTGLIADGLTEILSGVQEGEEVVVVGQFDLRDSDEVQANRFAPWNKS